MFSLRRHTLLNTRQSRDHWTGLKMAARRTQINPPQVCVTPESLSHEVRQQLNRSSLRGGMCLIPFWNCPAKTCAMPNPGGAQPHTSERVDHRGSQVYTPIVLTARSNLDPTESMQETLVRCLHIQTNKFYRETGHLQIWELTLCPQAINRQLRHWDHMILSLIGSGNYWSWKRKLWWSSPESPRPTARHQVYRSSAWQSWWPHSSTFFA